MMEPNEPERRDEIEVPSALDGERLDRVLSIATGQSRSASLAVIEDGRVEVDGAVVAKGSLRLGSGQRIRFPRPVAGVDAELAADPSVPLTVLHEDDHVLVVDKEADLVVHPGAGQEGGTLVHGLLARYPELRQVGEPHRPGIVHRLDRGTSGLLVVARTERARLGLIEALAAHHVERRYWALVLGVPDAPTGTVDAPIGRSPRRRTAMAVVESGRPARTHYRVVATHDSPVPTAELSCELETGRTHQIRVHLASIGHPVVGDTRYGRPAAGPRLEVPRLCLHARHLAFDHPISGERIEIDSPLPQDLIEVLDQLT